MVLTIIRRSRLIIPLTAEDRLEVTVDKERGTVKGFVINHVATISGKEHSVVRYDKRHGFPHKDVVGRDGRVERKEPLPNRDWHILVDIAVDDLKANWLTYRRIFVR